VSGEIKGTDGPAPRSSESTFGEASGDQGSEANNAQQGKFAKCWAWVKDNAESLKIIAGVLAAVYALAEYKAKDYIDKVKNSSEVVEKFRRNDEGKALISLQDFYVSQDLSEMRKKLEDHKLGSDEYHKAVHSKLMKEHKKEFLSALRGLKAVAICAIQGRCDPTTLCMHMAQAMQDFRCDFRDVVFELSHDNGSCVVDEVNYFLDNHCTPWMAAYLGADYSTIQDNYCLYDKKTKFYFVGPECGISIIYKAKSNFFDRYFK
jgi:hypothetical protein